jgi:hypothetical protein
MTSQLPRQKRPAIVPIRSRLGLAAAEESGLQACYGKSPGNGAFSIRSSCSELVLVPPAVPAKVAQRIRAEHAAGRTLGQIARSLDADQISTTQGRRRW